MYACVCVGVCVYMYIYMNLELPLRPIAPGVRIRREVGTDLELNAPNELSLFHLSPGRKES